MKKWQRLFLILGIIFGCLLCITNIVLAIIFPSIGANIFTAISGWVSGFATTILGFIAVWQNKQYKRQGDKNRLLDAVKREVDLVDNIYYKYIESCDSAILIFNVQRLKRQENDVYFDNLIEFQIALSKIIDLIYNKINTMNFFINSNLCGSLETYCDLVDVKVNNWQVSKTIDCADLDEISEAFDKTQDEFINYNAKIVEFYNKSLIKTPEQLQSEVESMILERNKRFRFKIRTEEKC